MVLHSKGTTGNTMVSTRPLSPPSPALFPGDKLFGFLCLFPRDFQCLQANAQFELSPFCTQKATCQRHCSFSHSLDSGNHCKQVHAPAPTGSKLSEGSQPGQARTLPAASSCCLNASWTHPSPFLSLENMFSTPRSHFTSN